ncbi:aspartic protease [Phanerochaete sordida]|uniref:Aspartic protease n=1 Tax=Phanerochaete sordida TaxID=48140 RepID=A0A9P3LGI8_9APHY|nr:aspartic protease [Phanerochaete sordida]
MTSHMPIVGRFAWRYGRDIVARDRARAQKMLQGLRPHGPHKHRKHHAGREEAARHHGGGGSAAASGTGTGASAGAGAGTDPMSSGTGVDVTDAGVTYTATVGVGSPATDYMLLIDTGSSNTWLGASQKYVKTSTSKSTGASVSVSYGSGSFSGTEYTDTVTLAPTLVIENQSIGVASQAQGFEDVDGILGVGPADLTQNTVSGQSMVPTVVDNLFSQGTIAADSLGISFEPTTEMGAINGELTFGGVDASKITGDVTFVPITSTSPASNYWGINQDVTYGQDTALLSGAAGIVDTGTTLVMIATDAFQQYQQATGGTMDQSTGLLRFTESQFEGLQSLFFNIGGTTFELSPNAQIWPRALNPMLDGDADGIYSVVADIGTPSGQGLDFINGFAFLQRFYSVFDTGNAQVGLATTPFTDATTN